LDGAFHGRTLGALAATPRLAREDLFGPLPAGFVAVPRDDPAALRAAIGARTAGVMIEPIQGEAGIFPIADTVLLALGQAADVPAQGQGTMNNLVIGTPRWTYYETLGGGQGASSRGDGPSGVHVGMSNTLNTPIEALELDEPLRVERYELLDASGGAGRHRGGDGLVRVVRVLEPATLSLLTDRRRHAPQGREGGGPGRPGRNLVNGEELPPKATRELAAGDVVTVETPGGGGWGVSR